MVNDDENLTILPDQRTRTKKRSLETPYAVTGSYGAHVAIVIAVVLAAILICLVLVCFCSFMSKRMKKKRSGATLCGTGGFGLKKNTGYFKVQ